MGKSLVQLDQFFGVKSLRKVNELYSQITQPIFTIKDAGLNSRTISHWDNLGLIGIHRQSNVDWRRFSFMDYVWVQIIQELRSIGVPLAMIEKAKETLLSTISLKWIFEAIKLHPEALDKLEGGQDKEALLKLLEPSELEKIDESTNVSTLLLLTVDCITNRIPISIIVFHDGLTIPWYENETNNYSDEVLRKKIYETHTVISLASVIKKFLLEPKSIFVLPQINIIEENEKQLLEIIHSGKYNSVTIHFKNNKMKSLELIKDQDVKRRIVDVIADGSYQDIIVKTHKGLVTKIQNTVKVNFN